MTGLDSHVLQGGSIVDVHLQAQGWWVLRVTRDPSPENARAWKSKDAEMVQGNLSDAGSFTIAFRGATVIFGASDFWTIFRDLTTDQKTLTEDPTHEAFEVELRQEKALADSASKITTLHRYVFSSTANATEWSNGK